jgi:tripartite-type tricarboxylate transporter receptor subunit TctC
MRRQLFSAEFAAHAGAIVHAAEPPWKPARPMALAAIHAPGGGCDRILRLMVKVSQAQK